MTAKKIRIFFARFACLALQVIGLKQFKQGIFRANWTDDEPAKFLQSTDA